MNDDNANTSIFYCDEINYYCYYPECKYTKIKIKIFALADLIIGTAYPCQ